MRLGLFRFHIASSGVVPCELSSRRKRRLWPCTEYSFLQAAEGFVQRARRLVWISDFYPDRSGVTGRGFSLEVGTFDRFDRQLKAQRI